MDYFKSGSAKEDCNFTLRKQRRLRKRMVRILSEVYVVWTLQRGRRYGSTKAMSVPEVCARCLCLMSLPGGRIPGSKRGDLNPGDR